MLYLKVSGGLSHPGGGYPYGFVHPATAIQTLTLIARSVTLLWRPAWSWWLTSPHKRCGTAQPAARGGFRSADVSHELLTTAS